MCKVGVIRGQQPWNFPKTSLPNFLFKTRPQLSTTDVFLYVLVLTTGCFRSPIRYVYQVRKNKHSGPTVNPTPNFITQKNMENYFDFCKQLQKGNSVLVWWGGGGVEVPIDNLGINIGRVTYHFKGLCTFLNFSQKYCSYCCLFIFTGGPPPKCKEFWLSKFICLLLLCRVEDSLMFIQHYVRLLYPF